MSKSLILLLVVEEVIKAGKGSQNHDFHVRNEWETILLKRATSSDGTSLTEKQVNAEQDEAQRAALVLLDMSSTDQLHPKPIENLLDHVHVPQKVRSLRQRMSSKMLYSNRTPNHSGTSRTTNISVQIPRVYSQNRGAINQRNRMHRMKEFEPEKYQEYLNFKRQEYAKRKGKMTQDKDKKFQYFPRTKKEMVTNQTKKNRRYEDNLRLKNPFMLRKLQDRRKETSRNSKRKRRLAKKMQMMKDGSAPD